VTSEVRGIKTAVLLAAGKGIRLRPYTDRTPKPLLAYEGKPTLAWILESLQKAGISRAVIVTHHLEHQIRNYVADSVNLWGIDIHCVHQADLGGTAQAVAVALSEKPDWFDGYFLVSATDYIATPDFYSALTAFHHSHNGKMSISLKQLAIEELSSRSSVRFRGEFEISEVVEKPAAGQAPSEYSANLVYIFPPSIVSLFASVKPSARGEREVPSAVNQWLSENGRARGLLQAPPAEWQPPDSVHGPVP